VVEKLGGDIGCQLSLEQSDLVLEEELAFLESLHLELIQGVAVGQLRDYVVEVSVLYLQLVDFHLESLDVGGMYHG
jgi:hypothetical protein